jgi:PST family polysaccharide transporter
LLAQTASGRGASLFGQIILARVLSPSDFGTIGLTYTIITIIGFLTASGIGDVLVQRSRTFHIWAWPALWIDFGLASIGGALVFTLAPLGARLYGAPEIAGLARVAALGMPLFALSTIPLTTIRVSLNFKQLAAVGTAEVVAVQILSVLFAWYGMGAYSFVLPVPLVATVKSVWLWGVIRPRLRRMRARRAWLYLVTSGTWVWGSRLLVGLISQGGYFVLGLLASTQEVGFYVFAFRLAGLPLQMLAGNLFSVMFPILAGLRSEPDAQCRVALKASQVLAALVFFAAGLQAALAQPLLHFLFHSRWDGSILFGQLLSIGLAFDCVPWVGASLLAARGDFRTSLICNLVGAPGFFILVGIGGWFGRGLGVALGTTLYYAIFGPAYSYVAFRGNVGSGGIFRLYSIPFATAGSAVFAAYALANFLIDRNSPLAQATSIVVVATSLYAGFLQLCMPWTFSAIRTQARFVFLRHGRCQSF